MLTRLEGRRKRHAVHLLKTRSHQIDGKQKNADECQGVYHCDVSFRYTSFSMNKQYNG